MAAETILNQNLDNLEETILKFKENQLSVPTIDYDKYFLTERQSAKKTMMSNDKTISEEDAHRIVYGKLKYGVDGKLSDNEKIDPDCVDPKYAIPDNHPIMDEIRKKFKAFKKAVRTFMVNAADLIKNIPSLIASIALTIPAAIPAIAVLPPTAGVANVLVMFKSLLTIISEFLSKLPTILLVLEPISFLSLLISDKDIGTVVSPINGTLSVLNVSLGTISVIYNLVQKIVGVFNLKPPSPPEE